MQAKRGVNGVTLKRWPLLEMKQRQKINLRGLILCARILDYLKALTEHPIIAVEAVMMPDTSAYKPHPESLTSRPDARINDSSLNQSIETIQRGSRSRLPAKQ